MLKKLAIVWLIVFAQGCALRSHGAPPEDIDKAAGLFFQRLNAAEYETIYKDAAKKFKENQTKETILESLKELTARGKIENYYRLKMTFEGEGEDTRAAPIYSATFERGKGDMILYFVDESGEWKLIGFAFKQRG